jgi:hypothetical protein
MLTMESAPEAPVTPGEEQGDDGGQFETDEDGQAPSEGADAPAEGGDAPGEGGDEAPTG